ncbi:30S ribosomal protein S20 [Clostridiaceae bacterium M8S5]|nr:30S ribosomal protein S20 [Clostridiaceae bacterium M8S5]
MANIKSAKKRISVINTKTALNRQRKSEVRTYIKKLDKAIESKNFDDAKMLLRTIEKKLDKAVAKGTFHKSTASRKISRLNKKVNAAM